MSSIIHAQLKKVDIKKIKQMLLHTLSISYGLLLKKNDTRTEKKKINGNLIIYKEDKHVQWAINEIINKKLSFNTVWPLIRYST